jgi:hypothetical protein
MPTARFHPDLHGVLEVPSSPVSAWAGVSPSTTVSHPDLFVDPIPPLANAKDQVVQLVREYVAKKIERDDLYTQAN